MFLLLVMPLAAEAAWPGNPLDKVGEIWNKGKSAIGALANPGEFIIDQTIGRIFEGVGKLMFMLSSLFFSMASFLLDVSIAQSLDSNTLKNFSSLPSVFS